ncbi:hypothetical protein vBRpoSV10_182 [Ruegeria phage vB_RpoS-V10]|nr:hypothetical protein vBRpoSV10_182 [Ruegeria phage vB_RpoS-V10]
MTIYFMGTVLLTAPPIQKDMEFVALVQHLGKEFRGEVA